MKRNSVEHFTHGVFDVVYNFQCGTNEGRHMTKSVLFYKEGSIPYVRIVGDSHLLKKINVVRRVDIDKNDQVVPPKPIQEVLWSMANELPRLAGVDITRVAYEEACEAYLVDHKYAGPVLDDDGYHVKAMKQDT